MSYFDDMKVMLGRGMKAADRKTQELRLQAELSRVGSSLEAAYAALGKVVYSHPQLALQVQNECPGEYGGVTSLLKDEQSVMLRIQDLQRQAAASSIASAPRQPRQFSCPKCGMHVTLDLSYCPNCGDNLADLKQGYRMCPNCEAYYTADSMFCMECGSKTVEIPVATQVAMQVQASAAGSEPPFEESEPAIVPTEVHSEMLGAIEDTDAQAVEEEVILPPEKEPVDAVATTPHCPNCGSVVAENDVFCGECGARLNG